MLPLCCRRSACLRNHNGVSKHHPSVNDHRRSLLSSLALRSPSSLGQTHARKGGGGGVVGLDASHANALALLPCNVDPVVRFVRGTFRSSCGDTPSLQWPVSHASAVRTGCVMKPAYRGGRKRVWSRVKVGRLEFMLDATRYASPCLSACHPKPRVRWITVTAIGSLHRPCAIAYDV